MSDDDYSPEASYEEAETDDLLDEEEFRDDEGVPDGELDHDEEEYISEPEEDDDLTDFQKMINIKHKRATKTSPLLTKYELAALIGFRAQQIAEGAAPYVDVAGMSDPSAIAAKELDEGLLPFTIERPLPSRKIGKFVYEMRTLNELINVNRLV